MKAPTINIIVALASDGAIGRRGDLLYHVGADMRHFKAVTMGHPIIMGRKTFESLPNGPLPGRRNVIVSRNAGYVVDGAEVVPSLESAVELCGDSDEVFIIGGAQIYSAALPLADRLILTRFDRTEPDADSFFPVIDESEWRIVEAVQMAVDEKTGVGYGFETIERIK